MVGASCCFKSLLNSIFFVILKENYKDVIALNTAAGTVRF
jgi:hypothetical protein